MNICIFINSDLEASMHWRNKNISCFLFPVSPFDYVIFLAWFLKNYPLFPAYACICQKCFFKSSGTTQKFLLFTTMIKKKKALSPWGKMRLLDFVIVFLLRGSWTFWNDINKGYTYLDKEESDTLFGKFS